MSQKKEQKAVEKKALLLGGGYVGAALARHLCESDQQWQVTVVKRSPVEINDKRYSSQVTVVPIDLTNKVAVDDWTNCQTKSPFDLVVFSLSAGAFSEDAYRKTYVEALKNTLESLKANPPGLFVFCSSTSVYGQNPPVPSK